MTTIPLKCKVITAQTQRVCIYKLANNVQTGDGNGTVLDSVKTMTHGPSADIEFAA